MQFRPTKIVGSLALFVRGTMSKAAVIAENEVSIDRPAKLLRKNLQPSTRSLKHNRHHKIP